LIAKQLQTLRPTPIHTLQQEILLAAHNPVTGNPASLESFTTEPQTETSSDTTSPPSTPQTPSMSGTATAPAIHVSVTCMPACGHSTVPHVDSNALNLHLYFDEVESLSIDTGLNKEGKIQHTLHYASREDNKQWSTLPEAKAQLPYYAKFHDAVMKLYPGADDKRKYAESDLQQLIDTQWQYGIESRAELGHYY
jgi:hypothetical protein